MTNIMKDIETHKTVTIPAIFIILFITLILFVGAEEFTRAFTVDEIAFTIDKFFEDNLVKLGFISIFLYELIPTAFRLLGTTGFFIGLLNVDIHPMLLILVASVGRLAGWYLLYLLGRFIFRIFKGKSKDLAGAEHFLHKYRLLIFFLVPFLGALGDLIMIISGHQRLGFARIAPILLFANILRSSIWLYFTIGQIDLVTGG